MFKTGLCSVTFRDLKVEEVVDLAQKADLDVIEWGGDVHVPAGDLYQAEKVAQLTKEAGLDTEAYGSYYRIGYDENKHSFAIVIETAVALKAPAIRVWAGRKGSEEADAVNRKKVADEARQIAEEASKYNIAIHLEYHIRSLTDTAESTKQLMEEINHPNVYVYWQPAISVPVEDRLKNIRTIKPYISHVHVFHWQGTERLPFVKGMNEWRYYLEELQTYNTRYLLLEFVKDDDIEQFLQDIQNLKHLIKNK